jgi:hypothetical protein
LMDAYLARGGEFPVILEVLRESLRARFEAGFLIQMGEVHYYRDHEGTLVIQRGVRECERN